MAATLLETCFDTICANCTCSTTLAVKNVYSVWQNTDYDGVKCTSFCGYNYYCACTSCPMGQLFSVLYNSLDLQNKIDMCFPVSVTGKTCDEWSNVRAMKTVFTNNPVITFYDRNNCEVRGVAPSPNRLSNVDDSIILSFVGLEL